MMMVSAAKAANRKKSRKCRVKVVERNEGKYEENKKNIMK